MTTFLPSLLATADSQAGSTLLKFITGSDRHAAIRKCSSKTRINTRPMRWWLLAPNA